MRDDTKLPFNKVLITIVKVAFQLVRTVCNVYVNKRSWNRHCGTHGTQCDKNNYTYFNKILVSNGKSLFILFVFHFVSFDIIVIRNGNAFIVAKIIQIHSNSMQILYVNFSFLQSNPHENFVFSHCFAHCIAISLVACSLIFNCYYYLWGNLQRSIDKTK